MKNNMYEDRFALTHSYRTINKRVAIPNGNSINYLEKIKIHRRCIHYSDQTWYDTMKKAKKKIR